MGPCLGRPHCLRLPTPFKSWKTPVEAFLPLPPRSTVQKILFVAAFLSWQECVCFGALALWALLAFSPDLLVPGSGWPLTDVTSWVWMQLDWAWQSKGQILLESVITGVFAWACFWRCVHWLQRRQDLQAISSIRRLARTGAPPSFPSSLLPQDGDNRRIKQEKSVRLL
jgi:hypothetical protein